MATDAPQNAIQCSRCSLIHVLPQPGDTAHFVRFCLAEWPQPRLCMYCCNCIKCMRARYSQEGLSGRTELAATEFLDLRDAAFIVYCRIEDEL